MKVIWKYQLELKDSQEISMPRGAKILTVQTQSGIPCLWVLVDPERMFETKLIRIFGTGNDFELVDYKYIGTFQINKGDLIFHVFESNF
jgi:hypothetical protein